MRASCIVALAALAAAVPVPGDEYSTSPSFGGLELPETESPEKSGEKPSKEGDKDKEDKDEDKWPKVMEHLADFDDLEPIIPAAVEEVGEYMGLDYSGLYVVEVGIAGEIIGGVIPHSEPNAAVYSTVSAMVDEPTISAKYEKSKVEVFDLHEFWFGCQKGTVESLLTTPISCELTAHAFLKGEEIATHTFEFTFDELIDGPTIEMIKADLGEDFKGIDTVTFTTEYQLGLDVASASIIDDLKYTTYPEGKGKPAEKKGEMVEKYTESGKTDPYYETFEELVPVVKNL